MHANTAQLVRKAAHALFDKLHGIAWTEDESRFWDHRREIALLVQSVAESYLKDCDQRATEQRAKNRGVKK